MNLDEIKRLEKRLIRVSNIETYSSDKAIKKAGLVFKLAGELSNKIAEAHLPENMEKEIKELIKESLR